MVREVVVHHVCELDLIQVESCRDVKAGTMVVNCFELERQQPKLTKTKMKPGSSLGGGKVRKTKKLGFFLLLEKIREVGLGCFEAQRLTSEVQAQTKEGLLGSGPL